MFGVGKINMLTFKDIYSPAGVESKEPDVSIIPTFEEASAGFFNL